MELLIVICSLMIAIGVFILLLIPRSAKAWVWCLAWGSLLFLLLNRGVTDILVTSLGITGIMESRLVVETLLLGTALLGIAVYVLYLGAQLRKVTETTLAMLTPRRMPSEKVSLIMPAFNEEASIGSLTDRLVKIAKELGIKNEIVLVDDGSKDRTGQICDDLAKKHDTVRSTHHSKNLGKTKAFETGVSKATGDVVVLLETDWQYDPRDLVSLLMPLSENYDAVNGWRIHRRDRFYRIWMSKVYNFILRRMFGTNLRDHNSGYKAFRKKTALDIYKSVNKIGLTGPHRFFMVMANNLGYRVAEVPVRHLPRTSGTSYISPVRTPLQVLYDMIKTRYFLTYRRKLLSD